MSKSFKMTDSRLKKLKQDIMENHPDVMDINSTTRKRKQADLVLKDLRINGIIQDVYLERVEQMAIRDLELFDSKPGKSDSGVSSSVVVPPSDIPVSKPKVKSRKVKVPKLVHFSPGVLSKLDEIASDMDCSSSFLIRQAVDKYLKDHK